MKFILSLDMPHICYFLFALTLDSMLRHFSKIDDYIFLNNDNTTFLCLFILICNK